jgi:hypothetical protein
LLVGKWIAVRIAEDFGGRVQQIRALQVVRVGQPIHDMAAVLTRVKRRPQPIAESSASHRVTAEGPAGTTPAGGT